MEGGWKKFAEPPFFRRKKKQPNGLCCCWFRWYEAIHKPQKSKRTFTRPILVSSNPSWVDFFFNCFSCDLSDPPELASRTDSNRLLSQMPNNKKNTNRARSCMICVVLWSLEAFPFRSLSSFPQPSVPLTTSQIGIAWKGSSGQGKARSNPFRQRKRWAMIDYRHDTRFFSKKVWNPQSFAFSPKKAVFFFFFFFSSLPL